MPASLPISRTLPPAGCDLKAQRCDGRPFRPQPVLGAGVTVLRVRQIQCRLDTNLATLVLYPHLPHGSRRNYTDLCMGQLPVMRRRHLFGYLAGEAAEPSVPISDSA